MLRRLLTLLVGMVVGFVLTAYHLPGRQSTVVLPPVVIHVPIVKTVFDGDYVTYEVTAYTADYESTGKRPGDDSYGITASGRPVQRQRTIACPPSLPFGTHVYIPYFNNVYVCEDRGSAIKGRHLDVYMADLERALAFGRRKLDVLILPH